MKEIGIIGIDTSKNVFQLHAAKADGTPLLRKKLSRNQLLGFFVGLPPCVVVLEACGASHHWARQIQSLGHECKLIAPIYVRAFVKRQKNDARDAEAIVEAALRPTMSFVAVKSEFTQSQACVFRTRSLLVRQRTQLINSLRGQLAEFGIVAAKGVAKLAVLQKSVEKARDVLLEPVLSMAELLFAQIEAVDNEIAKLDRRIKKQVGQSPEMDRLMTIPGVGPLSAMAVHALAPSMEVFGSGRDFAAWVGLTPRQHSTAGKSRLGRITKKGQRDLRRLLVNGATSVLRRMRSGDTAVDPWIRRMLAEKPFKVVAVALANRMARIIWAVSVKQEAYRAAPAPATG